MLPRQSGSIIFSGATASIRGGSEFAAFSAAKFGLRALAQSMARELGPKGLHVANVVIDGVIDMPRTHERFPGLRGSTPEDGLMQTADIAQAYLSLHRQPRSAWSHEVDLRPWCERF
jgi:NAD(P)-dependent dehydrogenase (short-subunit alcohol dehydrogenase family)